MSSNKNRSFPSSGVPQTGAAVTGLTGPAAAVWTELHERPDGATVAALALAVGISRSTASKALTSLEERGLARRTGGGNDRTRRLPDIWHLPAADTSTSSPVGANDSTASTADLGPTLATLRDNGATPDTDQATAECQDAEEPLDIAATPGTEPAEEDADTATPFPAPDGAAPSGEETADPRREPDSVPGAVADGRSADAGSGVQQPGNEPVAPVTAPTVAEGEACPTCGHRRRTTPPAPTRSSGTRLGQGQLHQLALDHLRAHPEQEWTATGIAKEIGRSSGAIANALATMADRGEAEMTCAAPRRYRALLQPETPTAPPAEG